MNKKVDTRPVAIERIVNNLRTGGVYESDLVVDTLDTLAAERNAADALAAQYREALEWISEHSRHVEAHILDHVIGALSTLPVPRQAELERRIKVLREGLDNAQDAICAKNCGSHHHDFCVEATRILTADDALGQDKEGAR